MIEGTFPTGIHLAIGYGSGVFEQKGYHVAESINSSYIKEEPPMIDMIFVVEDDSVIRWHKENIQRNPSHYGAIPRLLGGEFVSKVQRTSAQIYYNTLVPIPEEFAEDLSKNSKYMHGKQLMKYGVIGRSDFLDDLLNWTNLYVSGRLHKPVAVLTDIEESSGSGASSDVNIERQLTLHVMQRNLRTALSTAILMLPGEFSEMDLYKRIASLSYEGDFRMSIAENPNKVDNIITKGDSYARFQGLYKGYINALVRHNVIDLTNTVTQENDEVPEFTIGKFKRNDSAAVKLLIPELPILMGQHIASDKLMDIPSEHEKVERVSRICRQTLSNTVSQFSRSQTLKGLLTAGVSKSLIYSMQKILKRLK